MKISQLDVWLVVLFNSSCSSVLHSEFLPSTWSFRTSLLIIRRIFWSKCHFGSFLGTGTLRKDSSTCPSTPNAGSLCPTCSATQVAFVVPAMQRRCLVEQLQWSKTDLFLSVFNGEMICSAVVCWPCSSKGKNNMFRDFGSLRLLTFHALCCKAQKCL